MRCGVRVVLEEIGLDFPLSVEVILNFLTLARESFVQIVVTVMVGG